MAIGATLVDDLKLLFEKEPFYCSLLFDGSYDMTEKEAISIKVMENGVPKIFSLG